MIRIFLIATLVVERKKSCVNHIFIINGIIHETLSSKKNKSARLQVYDYIEMFDSMDLEEAVSDLFNTGVTDDSLCLLYEANKDIKVQVKTPHGLSAENSFKKSPRRHMGTNHGSQSG